MFRINSLFKTFRQNGKELTVLCDLELKISKKECVVIEGPSGSGKTTLLNIMGCLARPTKGEVFMNGRRISHLPDHFLCDLRRTKIGFIFQQFNLLAGFTVIENVVMPQVPLGISEAHRHSRAVPLLDLLGIEDKANVPVNLLSGGEQQRVAIARALMNDPEVIIADEPFSNVDTETAERLIDIFNGLIRSGKTLILASHEVRFRELLSVTSKYELENGRLV